MPLRILLVEDEACFRDGLRDILNLEGFVADGVGSIASYKAWRQSHTCDVLVVDRRLPDGDGLDVVRMHRQTERTPVIIITAKGQIEDRIAGIDADADYYLVKPVVTDELLAILKRLQRRDSTVNPEAWLLDLTRWRLRLPLGEEIPLTRTDVSFLSCFIEKSGLPIPRNEIILTLGKDPDTFDIRRLEATVRRLRRKVEANTSVVLPLTTVYGVGYAFNSPLSEL